MQSFERRSNWNNVENLEFQHRNKIKTNLEMKNGKEPLCSLHLFSVLFLGRFRDLCFIYDFQNNRLLFPPFHCSFIVRRNSQWLLVIQSVVITRSCCIEEVNRNILARNEKKLLELCLFYMQKQQLRMLCKKCKGKRISLSNGAPQVGSYDISSCLLTTWRKAFWVKPTFQVTELVANYAWSFQFDDQYPISSPTGYQVIHLVASPRVDLDADL